MDKVTGWKRGDTIPNGALLVEVSQADRDGFRVVLALALTHHREFVVWNMDKGGGCMTGFYSQTLMPAVEEFNRRASL